jgi:galactose mutarotase-like enzyme
VFTGLELESENTLDCWTEGREEIVMKDGHRAVMNVRRHVEIPACLAGSEHRPIRHVQLYTPPGRNAICLEPLSAPPNAVNLAARNNAHADLCELAPTAQALFEMRIRMEANALDSGAAE